MKKKCARILQQSSIQSTNHPHDVLKQIIFQSSCTLQQSMKLPIMKHFLNILRKDHLSSGTIYSDIFEPTSTWLILTFNNY